MRSETAREVNGADVECALRWRVEIDGSRLELRFAYANVMARKSPRCDELKHVGALVLDDARPHLFDIEPVPPYWSIPPTKPRHCRAAWLRASTKTLQTPAF